MSSHQLRGDKLLKPLEQLIEDNLNIKETNREREFREHNTAPDEPHQIVNGTVIQPEPSQVELDLKELERKSYEIMSRLEESDEVLEALQAEHSERSRHLLPALSEFGRHRYRKAIRMSERHCGTREEAIWEYLNKEWKHRMNEGWFSPSFDFRHLSEEQKKHIFRTSPAVRFVEQDDAFKLYNFLESQCPYYTNAPEKDDVEKCPCLNLPWERKISSCGRGNLLHFVAANHRHEFLQRLYDMTGDNEHFKKVIVRWLCSDVDILSEAMFRDINHKSEGEREAQNETIEKLCRVFREIPDISVKHKTDFQKSFNYQTFLSYLTANQDWQTIKNVFNTKLKFNEPAHRDLIGQFLVDLVYTRDSTSIQTTLSDIFEPWAMMAGNQPLDHSKVLALLFPKAEWKSEPETCLHAAVRVGDLEIFSAIFDSVQKVFAMFGFDVDIQNAINIEGQNALEMAIAHGQRDIANILWNHVPMAQNYKIASEFFALMEGEGDVERILNQFRKGVTSRFDPNADAQSRRLKAYGRTPMLTALVVLEEFELAYEVLDFYGRIPSDQRDQYIVADLDGSLEHFPRRLRNDQHENEEEFAQKRLDMFACLLAAGAKYPGLESGTEILRDPSTSQDLVLFYDAFVKNKEEADRRDATLPDIIVPFYKAAFNIRKGFYSD